MIIGTGIDAVNIQRAKRLDNAFVQRYFSPEEIREYEGLKSSHEDVRAQFLASRFAVKEAYAKACGTGFCENVVPSEISTVKDKNGKPMIELAGRTLKSSKKATVHLSITHEDPLAIAMVILEEPDV